MRTSLITLTVIVSITLADGTWVDTTLVPPSLGYETPVMIYLPEGYDPGGTIDYPVIYWLHGWYYTGEPGHNKYMTHTKIALDSLISSGQIGPVLVVKPNGTCGPYNGSYWANSELSGDIEDYVVYDLVEFIDSTFCTISDPEYRCIAGHSMGGCGSMRISLEHPDRYRASASHAGYHDFQVAMPPFIAAVLDECPETEPPYTYNWGNGFYTDALFMGCGAYSPNLNAPDSIDLVIDENGVIIDSVYARWELFNPVSIAKTMSLPVDLDIFFDCGDIDAMAGCYLSNCSFSDTLSGLGVVHEFQSLATIPHQMSVSRFIEAFLFLDEAMTGISETTELPAGIILEPAFPNPFTNSTMLSFELPESGHTTLQVFDLSGRLFDTLINENLREGHHSVVFNAEDCRAGVYLFRLHTGSAVQTMRCVLLR